MIEWNYSKFRDKVVYSFSQPKIRILQIRNTWKSAPALNDFNVSDFRPSSVGKKMFLMRPDQERAC